MKVQARAANSKRHTIGWKVGGQWRTRAEAVDLAVKGKLDGVTVRCGSNDGKFIASLPQSGLRLYDLPVKVDPCDRIVRRAAK